MNISNQQALEFRRRRAANSISTTLAARIARVSRTQFQRFEDGAVFFPVHTLLRMHGLFLLAEELCARRGKIVRFGDPENTERAFASWMGGAPPETLAAIIAGGQGGN